MEAGLGAILLVDAQIERAGRVQRALVGHGLEVCAVLDIAHAEQVLRELQVDVAVVHDQLPERNGLAFLRRIGPEFPGVARVLVTPVSRRLFKRELDAGVLDAVVSDGTLVDVVRDMVVQPWTRRQRTDPTGYIVTREDPTPRPDLDISRNTLAETAERMRALRARLAGGED